MKKIKVFIIEDHKIVREGLIALLSTNSNIEIAGESESGEGMIEILKEKIPDVIVMDIVLPGLNGIEITRNILKELPGTKILLLSMYSDPEYVLSAVRSGIKGYILKGEGVSDLIKAIEIIEEGGSFFSTQIKKILDDNSASSGIKKITLSEREKEVLQLIAEGKTSFEIGKILFISPKTVDVHRTNIMAKLDLHNIAGLVKYALKIKLTNL